MYRSYILFMLNLLVPWALLLCSSPFVVGSVYGEGAHQFFDLLSPALAHSSSDIRTIPGHGGYTAAYEMTDADRQLIVPRGIMHNVAEKLEASKEFTVLFLVKQKTDSVGTFLSLSTPAYDRLFEVESSGRRDELRIHVYSDTKRRSVTETFPANIADGHWHQLAISVSRSGHLQLYIDCRLSSERPLPISPRQLATLITLPHVHLWLGQRATHDGLLKGALQYVRIVFSSQGFLAQCPHGNIGCPTCSQFNRMESVVDQLQSVVDSLTQRLADAESRLSKLEACECQRSCQVHGIIYNHGDSWRPDSCTSCQCQSGEVVCKQTQCPVIQCKNPVQVKGQCCPTCLNLGSILRFGQEKTHEHCLYYGVYYEHGETVSFRQCTVYTCQDGRMVYDERHNETKCPNLICPSSQQISLPGKCCKYCIGSDFCSTANDCHVNATCSNQNTSYTCHCNEGFQGDGHVCSDIDECAISGGPHGHQCHSHAYCVNTYGSYECRCPNGFEQVDELSCTDKNECVLGEHQCHHSATCINSPGSYWCRCQLGYIGDGFTCSPVCDQSCAANGVCLEPGVCQCRSGYMGANCTTDIDECTLGMASCGKNSRCVNQLGSYQCVCLAGFASLGQENDNMQGHLCEDVNECEGWGEGHSCPSNSLCINTPGSYQCLCSEDEQSCSTGCHANGRFYLDTERWSPLGDQCTSCQCQAGTVSCERVQCDCSKLQSTLGNSKLQSTLSNSCCAQCDIANIGQCRRSDTGDMVNSGDIWRTQCHACQCYAGEIDCWSVDCDVTTSSQCSLLSHDISDSKAAACQKMEDDPCLSVTRESDASVSCLVGNVTISSGGSWRPFDDQCISCHCLGGAVCCRTSNQCGGHFSKSSEEQTTSLVEKWRSSLAPPVNTISPVASELFSINQSSSVTPPIISKISYRSNVGSENEAKQDTVDDLSISNGTKDKDKLLAYPSQSVTDDLEVRPAGGKLSDTTHSIDDDDLQGRQLLNNNDVNKKSSSSTPKKRDKQKAKAKQTVPDPTSLGSRLNNGKDRKLTPRAKTAKQHLTALSDDDDSKLLSDEKNKKGRNLQTNLEQLRKKKKVPTATLR